MQGSVLGPVSYRASGGRLRATSFYTRIAVVTPATPSPAGASPLTLAMTYPLEMSWGQGTPGGEPPFPIAGPPLTMGTRCPWPWGQRCTIVAVFASCLLLGI